MCVEKNLFSETPTAYLFIVFWLHSVFVPSVANADLCTFNATEINSQEVIDNFQANYGPCDEIPLNLTVEGEDITNLDGLAGIRIVNGWFFISGNPMLSDVSGLSDLELVTANVSIDLNPALSSLHGLHNLERIEGSFGVFDMESIDNLDDFSSLAEVSGRLTISGNAVLTSISGLGGIETASRVIINDNPLLQSLEGVGQFNYLQFGLEIRNNDSLTNLDALSGLEKLDASIMIICGNDYCTSLAISGNDGLQNLNGLAQLSWAIGSVAVENNSSLADCTGLETLLNQRDDGVPGPGPGEEGIPDVGRFVFWGNNASGCNSLNEFVDVFELEGFENIQDL